MLLLLEWAYLVESLIRGLLQNHTGRICRTVVVTVAHGHYYGSIAAARLGQIQASLLLRLRRLVPMVVDYFIAFVILLDIDVHILVFVNVVVIFFISLIVVLGTITA